MITVHDCQQGTEEWLALRGGLYTGNSAHKLLRFGAIEYSKSASGNFSGNFWTKRGHVLEDEAIGLYEAIYETKVDRPGFVTNSKYPLCGFSPDGLTEVPLIEVKCFDLKEHMKLVKGDIKLSVAAQIHFGLLITERPYAHLIAYNPNKELSVKEQFVVITIKRNPAILQNFKRKLQGVVA